MQPIAIVGMACRFPGAENLDAFWQLLHDGIDAITEVPPDRWDINSLYDPDSSTFGKMSTRWGGFLKNIDQFDPPFFKISPREAEYIDPQQRLLLEVSWEALENAGLTPDKLAGSQTGVFIGISTNDYGRLALRDYTKISAFSGTGGSYSIAANRISYALDLRGPSIAVDTACSSSLVALHLACQSLQTGESNLALVGGSNLILTPEVMIGYSQAQMMAADGRCKTFDARADGFVRGEGCGIVVLKRLSEAIADKDNILAIARGSAVNQDGLTNGISAPNPTAQKTVIIQALENADIAPEQISYVEAHGTGTVLGDPIEVNALKAALMPGRSPDQICTIGSVKTNIGHLEAASGMASLIKVVLSLQYEEIPPHLHLQQLNPKISLEGTGFVIPLQNQPWKSGTKPRIAGINSFGFGGTNAHAIIEEMPRLSRKVSDLERPHHLLTLRAKSQTALRSLASRYAAAVKSHPDISIADVCFTANIGRANFAYRLAVVASSPQQLSADLQTFADVGEVSNILSDRAPQKTPQVVFLFTGQGSQYVGMGRQLYETQPTFRQTLNQCDEILRPYLEKSLLEVLYPQTNDPTLLDRTAYTQPALFAIEYALAQLWQSWGIVPDVVMGHSVGEYVAACVAGVFSLADGLKLMQQRGQLVQELPPDGNMAVVFASEERVAAAIAPFGKKVSIAAVNTPENTVISGDRQAIQTLLQQLESFGISAKSLAISHAFHSPLMEPILDKFEEIAAKVEYSLPQIPVISNVTGKLVSGEELTKHSYWRNHLREPVKFYSGMQTLNESGYKLFVEIGPSPILLGMGRKCLPDSTGDWLPSLRKEQDDWQQLLQSLATLYVRGVVVDWSGFDRDYSRYRLQLPTYPWERSRYWISSEIGPQFQYSQNRLRTDLNQKIHPLLGYQLRSALKQIQFETQLSGDSPAYLKDHQVNEMVVLPAAAYLEMACAAASKVFGSGFYCVEDVSIHTALILPKHDLKTVQFILTSEEEGNASFQILSLSNEAEVNQTSWQEHASGKIRKSQTDSTPNSISIEDEQTKYQQALPIANYYQQFQEQGLEYGMNFQAIQQLWREDGKALGLIQLPEALIRENQAYELHPVLLDGCFQLFAAALTENEQKAANKDIYLPISIESLRIYQRSCSRLWGLVVISSWGADNKTLTGNLRLFQPNGTVVAEVTGLLLKKVPKRSLSKTSHNLTDWLYQLKWQPSLSSVSSQSEQSTHWLIFCDRTSIGTELARLLKQSGDNYTLIYVGENYQVLNSESYQINPSQPEDFHRLLNEVQSNEFGGTRPLLGIVHLWSLDSTIIENQVISCGSVLHLVQAIASATENIPVRLWLITRGTQAIELGMSSVALAQVCIWGLGNVITLEHPELHCVRVDLSPLGDASEIHTLFEELHIRDSENQVAFRHQVRYVPRLVPMTSESGIRAELNKPYRLEIFTRGVLDNLTLEPTTRPQPGSKEVEIQVRATGLNFRDVLNALGMYPGNAGSLGIECAGEITAVGEGVENFQVGDAVLGIASGCFSTFVLTNAALIVHKPENLSFEEAATIPIAFLTAYYGLHYLAKIQPGERVLIHSAAGGVGVAAVQLAQQANAEIYGTASLGKWEFLQSLGVPHIMNSRSLDFADKVRTLTNEQGIDIVLNSLSGDFISKSLSLLSENGRFLEIGKAGIWDENQVAQLRKDISYFPFDLAQVCQDDPNLIQLMFRELITGFHQGTLKPLPHTTYSITQASKAFRFMAQAKHIGKVVISHTQKLQEVNKFNILSKATYLISGGLGSLGLKIAQWLVEQGVRHLVLVGRNEASAQTKIILKELEEQGTQILVAQADISQKEQVTQLLLEISESLPPLRGVIHAAGILDDGVLLQQNLQRFAKVMAPKVEGAWNLHLLTQDIPLDFFVCFSSVASLLGSAGQGNYAAANAFLDALAHHRNLQGLPSLSINWGPWSNIGMAANLDSQKQRRLATQGMGAIAPEQGLEILEHLFGETHPQVGVLPINWSQFVQQFSTNNPPILLSELVKRRSYDEQEILKSVDILHLLKQANVEERKVLLINYIGEYVVKVVGLSSSHSLDFEQPLSELGIDSLMAVELKNRIEKNLGLQVPIAELLSGTSVIALAETLILQLDSSVQEKELQNSAGGSEKQSISKWIVHHKSDPNTRVRLFCFHFLGGGASAFREWENELPSDIEVCPIQLPGRENRLGEQPFTQMAPLVETLVEVLLPYLDKPFAFYGHSMGAIISFELARQLRRCEYPSPIHLFIAAYWAPHLKTPFQQQGNLVKNQLPSIVDIPTSILENVELIKTLKPTLQADRSILNDYTYLEEEPFNYPISVFGGLEDEHVRDQDLAPWRIHTCKEFQMKMFPGKHLFLLSERKLLLRTISEQLKSLLV
ncbi:SDR family NAD(P)-dependent oxidoreductase [Nostoc sp. C117]|uniref:SDR family NAD(P)-dependent oxidoreductase n=1 Tax=Nostoc sp. C117 TaxID=3349875 RepID=UPI00370D16C3